MNKKNVLLILFFSLMTITFFCGCSTLAVKRDESMAIKSFSDSYDKVWDNLIDIIAKKGDTIIRKDKTKGIILTGYDHMEISELKRLGKMPTLFISSGLAGAWLYARNKADYSVKKISANETQVKFILYLQGFNASGQRWINIFTNGIKEKEIFDELQFRLQSASN